MFSIRSRKRAQQGLDPCSRIITVDLHATRRANDRIRALAADDGSAYGSLYDGGRPPRVSSDRPDEEVR